MTVYFPYSVDDVVVVGLTSAPTLGHWQFREDRRRTSVIDVNEITFTHVREK